ncbi:MULTISPECIES: hypothetical protein [Bizionia]|uniref:Uncharacterized protein n=1 Tax=Bizionia algoritergicola TaxID=291187 RepID=A0A5D0R1H0_9FLAO|nr:MULTISPECIES: hypothetical protein [Bizionia]OBX24438.1 hypothetical protein BAA08_01195 [Bizionia sp. APA-3]TYB75362.1 hypothetical protein ES675_04340 [Bizionia algoritergicola]
MISTYKNRFHRSIISLIFIVTSFGFQSCQSLLKSYTGIKNPEIEISSQERLDYYQPYTESTKAKVAIYSFLDVKTLQNGFNTFKNYPNIIIKNNSTKKIYKLNCYDDLDLYIEDINNNIYTDLLELDEKDLQDISRFIENGTEIVFTKNEITQKKWNVYLVSGTFLGKKLRKKSLSITQIKDLNQLTILDLSMTQTAD